MKKLFALLLAVMMVCALCACGGGDKAEEPAAPAVPAAAPDAAAPGAAEGDLDSYKTYILAYAKAGAPNEEEAANVENLVKKCATVEEVEAIPQFTVLFENVGVLRFDEWVAAGCPEADTSNMTMGDPSAGGSGEPSGEPTGEPPADAPAA